MKYKGYEAVVKFDEDNEQFHGEVINTRDVITFQGSSVRELKKAFKDSVEDYLEFCQERNEEPDRPFSGNFVVRISPELHKRLYRKAKLTGKSLNSLIEERLSTIKV
jgi:predicted HicB family RNase H-like nuclease